MKFDKVLNVIWKTATTTMFGFTLVCFGLVGWETKKFFQNFSSWSERRKLKEQIAKEIMSELNEQEEQDKDVERILGISAPEQDKSVVETVKSDATTFDK
ncbi:hypothetical protein C9374_000606 [Naegleria lovaniensis]|uniref:Uncharacterized protein n=1 Tax=Naegleria lovaniensis TaxID=51637 RepID=A0AA88GWP8_NAELO|nr:uncharacterized protein C9374_000606 [Naegleria lovaniensis]KAG2388442.1 hypothetical protein C9374_000606 [Naegleria lovaniensis]